MKTPLRLSGSRFPPTALLAFAASGLAGLPGDIPDGWPVPTDGVIFGAPAIGPHGEIVVGSEDNAVYSFNPDGSRRWIFLESTDWIDSSPAIAADGTVYVGSWDGNLYAIAGESGTLKWKFPTGSLIITAPAIGPDGTVYVGSYDGLFYALTPSGSSKWTFEPWTIINPDTGLPIIDGSPLSSSVVLNRSGDTAYFGTENGFLYAVNTQTGLKRWHFRVPGTAEVKEINGAPAVGDDTNIYFGSQNGSLYCLTSGGRLVWSFPTAESIKSSPIVGTGGTVYFAAQDGYLYAVDSLGFQLWEHFVGDVFYCSPAMDAQGNLVIAGYAGSAIHGAATAFTVLDAQGALLWEHVIYGYNDSSPNIAPDGSIYIGAHEGLLYKFEGHAALKKGGWPRFMGNRRQTGFQPDLFKTDLVETFPAITLAVDGWVLVPWFGSGWLKEDEGAWVQHLDHGFIHVIGAGQWGVFFYDATLAEWFFAPSSAANFLYCYSSAHWLYHLPGTTVTTGRWFYDYHEGSWISEELF